MRSAGGGGGSALTTERSRLVGIGQVSVLQRLGTLEQQRVGGTVVGHGPVLRAARHDEEVAGPQSNRLGAADLDHEAARPTQEELVLVVVVEWELAVQTG